MLDGIPGLTTGKLVKMVIEAHASPERTDTVSDDKKFEFMYNPNTFTEKYAIQYTERQAPGESATELIFNRVPPKVWTFNFMLDGTGAAPSLFGVSVGVGVPGLNDVLPNSAIDVKAQIEKFYKVAYEYDGERHRPHYLKLIWGDALGDSPQRKVINCVMLSADVTYTLFEPGGKPLRAKVKAVFRESKDEAFRLGQRNDRSPDLSRIRSVEEADNLPLMSQKVYESPSHYIEVAQANKIKNFRRLRVGQELRFPPLRPASST